MTERGGFRVSKAEKLYLQLDPAQGFITVAMILN